MSIKLRELIRQVRQCKTAAEERGVIAKECALIRTAFKEKANEDTFRHRNVAKLLYIHMLGYPTHFGQIESLKLIASPKFPEKRIGYLGLMVLLDEKQEVLVLATSSMRNDFKHQNPYVVGLALCSLGNISSVDIARDLASEIEKLCRHPNPYIRKKAATCAIRVIRKCPELIDDFVSAATELLNDRNHAVLLSGVQLIIEMIRTDSKHVKTFRPLVGTCVKLLRNLVMAGYVSEYDVCGITDPFLQCKLIQLMRLLGTGDKEASDTMNDILAQVAINTEPTKNPGNAILYECVMTIMSIEAESGLRVLAINILGRFLLNRDNNIRYVALQTLCKCVSRDTQAIQRHRNTVVDCLKDADISIRRRALDLIYALVTKANVKPLVKELLNYLALAAGDVEFKSDLTDKICLVVEKFAPNKLWHIETIVAVLNTAGNFTRESVAIDLIYLIARTKELHAYSVHKVYQVLNTNKVNQLALINVGAWAIGEYGDLLVTPQGLAAANVDTKQAAFESAPTEAAVLALLARFVKSPEATIVTKEYVLNALAKLSARFKDVEAVKKAMATYSTSMSAELQQRSVEYIMLAGEKLTKLRAGVVARMPVLDAAKRAAANGAQSATDAKAQDEKAALPQAGEKDDYEDDDEQGDTAVPPKGSQLPAGKAAAGKGAAAAGTPSKAAAATKAQVAATPAPAPQPAVQPQKAADPFDVIFGGGGGGAAVAPAVQQQKKVEAEFDPLASMFMAGGGLASPAKPAPAAGAGAGGMASLLPGFGAAPAPAPVAAAAPAPAAAAADPFGGMFGPAVPAAAPAAANGEQVFPAANVFSGGGLSVEFVYVRQPANPALLTVKATSRNSTAQPFEGFDLKIAVPKYVKLTIAAASSATVAPHNGTPVTQTLTLENTLHGQKPLLVRAKIVYTVAGAPKEENVQISNFPA